MRGGFLNGPPPKKAKPAAAAVEDHTNLKAKSKDDTLKMPEVQEAMAQNLMNNKDQWLNQDFMAKLMAKPHLMQAF